RYSLMGAGILLLGFVVRYAAISKGFARSSGPDEVVSEQAVNVSTGDGFGVKSSALPVQPLRLKARATADVDLRVLGDSNTLYDEELGSGEVLNFEAHYGFEITANDRDRIELFINDQPLIGLPSGDGKISSVEITQFNYKEFLKAERTEKK
ncbi:MAG: hypothetical protein IIB00_10290, partial [candidate division Zixibacteria bacterium]|nr:hypothetical protein [candidate division Zixibacteria bacterium]